MAWAVSYIIQPYLKEGKLVSPDELLAAVGGEDEDPGLPNLPPEEHRRLEEEYEEGPLITRAVMRRRHELALEREHDPVTRRQIRDTIEELSEQIAERTEDNGD